MPIFALLCIFKLLVTKNLNLDAMALRKELKREGIRWTQEPGEVLDIEIIRISETKRLVEILVKLLIRSFNLFISVLPGDFSIFV